jgi:hypothetical protein
LSKLDLAIVVTLVAGCAFWIERGQRVVIDAPTQSEVAAAAAAAAAACPDSDSVPYSMDCIRFMSGTRWHAISTVGAAADSQPAGQAGAKSLGGSSPCPERDDLPYDDACLAYLQGATALGMRWRIRAPAAPTPLDAPTPVATVRGQGGSK